MASRAANYFVCLSGCLLPYSIESLLFIAGATWLRVVFIDELEINLGVWRVSAVWGMRDRMLIYEQSISTIKMCKYTGERRRVAGAWTASRQFI